MVGKYSSAFGYLMELLSVSVKELSDALKLERTTVSKWKNGVRQLKSNSVYFDECCRYFVDKNEKIGGGVLENFFASIYQGEDSSGGDLLRRSVARFIVNKDIGALPETAVCNDKSTLYRTYVSIYRGSEGRKSAVMQILDAAEASREPCSVTLMETDGFEWASSDIRFLKAFAERLEGLLNAGHKIDIIHLYQRLHQDYADLLRIFIPLCFHKNIRNYLFPSRLTERYESSIYYVRDKALVVGLCGDGKLSNMYSSVYRDAFSIAQFSSYIENIKSTIIPMLVTSKVSDKNTILNLFHGSAKRPEPTFYVGSSLSVTTMSEELLSEILFENKLPKADRDRCLSFYHSIRTCVENSPADSLGGYYIFIDDIKRPLAYDTIVDFPISCYVNKTVTITRKQYQRHFRDTANLLMHDPRYKFILNHGTSPFPCNAWIKRNNWCFGFNNQNKVLFTENLNIINVLMSSYEDIWDKTPNEQKQNDYVAAVLNRLSM